MVSIGFLVLAGAVLMVISDAVVCTEVDLFLGQREYIAKYVALVLPTLLICSQLLLHVYLNHPS